jgi:Haem-dependent oxidative N-demethylase, alpha subunit-like
VTSDAFWRDPPWRGGKGGYRMGLHPIDAAHWLTDRVSDTERARKLALLTNPATLVNAELDASWSGQQQVLAAVERQLGIAADAATAHWSPLVRAALLVPDDLCLMQCEQQRYRLTAACVCSPSYWHLADKIGRSLDGIHAPVPTLNAKLAPTMAQFFDRLPPGAVFQRRNWLIHRDDVPYHPTSEQWPAIARDDVAALFMRSERQTLRRLDPASIVFTIRVTCRPFADIVGYPAAMQDLLKAFDTMDSDERRASGYVHYGSAVTGYLRDALALNCTP